jgi:hypothetical protein
LAYFQPSRVGMLCQEKSGNPVFHDEEDQVGLIIFHNFFLLTSDDK